MRNLHYIFCLSFFAALATAQEPSQTAPVSTRSDIAALLSRTPSNGNDYFFAIHSIKDSGAIVPILQSVVNEPIEGNFSESGRILVKVSAVVALDLIGSTDAYSTLLGTARDHPEPEVRGAALEAFAERYIARVRQDSLVPSLNILELCFHNADDDTRVDSKEATIGQIARRGIKNWTGLDLGDEVNPQRMVTLRKEGREVSIKEYRRMMWEKTKDRWLWNTEKGIYEFQKKIVKIEEIEGAEGN